MNLLIAALLASIPAAITLGLESLSASTFREAGTAILFPGIFGAIALSGNANAFHLWVAAIWNFIFYFLLCWAIVALIGKALRRLNAPHARKS